MDSLFVIVICLLIVFFASQRHKLNKNTFTSAKQVTNIILPDKWTWQFVSESDATFYKSVLGHEIAIGCYTSNVFDQHVIKYCGCCYLISTLQILQDRLHVQLGKLNTASTMYPCFEFDMQIALDSFNSSESPKHEEDWNACFGGLPLEVMNQIHNGNVKLILNAEQVWFGFPCNFEQQDNDLRLKLHNIDVIENTPESVMNEILRNGPVVLGIGHLCILQANEDGMIDTSVVERKNHAVSVIGWKTLNGKKCWIVRNSWGKKNVPTAKPENKNCLGIGYNNCEILKQDWKGDQNNPGFVYVPFDYHGIKGIPSPWFKCQPSNS